MEIIDKRNNESKREYKLLYVGECFVYNNYFYIKIKVFDNENLAINLFTGTGRFFDNDTMVEPVTIKAIVEKKEKKHV